MAFDVAIHHRHSISAFNIDIQQWHSTLAFIMDLQHRHSTLACNIGMPSPVEAVVCLSPIGHIASPYFLKSLIASGVGQPSDRRRLDPSLSIARRGTPSRCICHDYQDPVHQLNVCIWGLLDPQEFMICRAFQLRWRPIDWIQLAAFIGGAPPQEGFGSLWAAFGPIYV